MIYYAEISQKNENLIEIDKFYYLMGTCETCVPAQQNTHDLQAENNNKTLSLSAKEAEHLSYKAFPEFLNTLKKEIEENQKIYKPFIPQSALLKVLFEFKKRYIDHQSCKELIALLIDFLSYCKNQSECEPKLLTTFTEDFSEQFASRWQRVRQNIYFANKSHLRVLSLIVQSPSVKLNNQGMHFKHYKMDLSQQSCEKLADIGLQMCQQHTGSFAFLTNFLWGSCLNLEKQGLPIEQIQGKYNKILEILCNRYRITPEINGKNDNLDIHSLKKQQQLIPKIVIDLRGRTNKEQFLNNYIMERAQEAKQKYDEFYKFIYQICKKNDGFRFGLRLRIKKRSEAKALMRIKQEILKNIYSENQLQQRMGNSRPRSNNLSLNEMVGDQCKKYKQKIQQIYDTLRQPIEFKVSDMLKCTCSFSVVEKINQCCTDIRDVLKTDKYRHLRLIQIDNRLKKATSDIVLKILFGNIITEIQFVVHLKVMQNSFYNKLNELKHSHFFTPLTQLSLMNDMTSNSYFVEAKAYIEGNKKREKQDYEQATTFKEVSKVFEQFVKSLPSKVELNQIYEGSIDLSLMREEFNLLNSLVKASNKGGEAQRSKWQVKCIEGEQCFELKEYQKGRAILKEALQDVVRQSELPLISEKMKPKLIKGQLKILKKLGEIQKESGNYILALEYYQNCLQIEEIVEGEGSMEASIILGNMGLVYFNQCQYPKALEAYKQSLEIKQRLKGKGSIETVLTLGNIGLVYANQGNYSKALQYYMQSLQIKERVKGKGNIDTAATLNNIGNLYRKQGDYSNAYPLFQQSLFIYKKYGKTQAKMVAKNLSICFKGLNYSQKREQLIKQYNLTTN